MIFNPTFEPMSERAYILVTCTKGVNLTLQEEIIQLGYEVYKLHDLGVAVKGSFTDAMRLNLYLRSASRVLLLIEQFEAEDPEALYKSLRELPWEKWIPATGYLCVTSTVNNPSITDTRFANLKTKDAIVDRIQEKVGHRPDSGPKRDHSVVYLYWYQDHVSIYVDTSGQTISKHGYRQIPFTAPLRESLAAALILNTNWDRQSHFVNPMCGSGTLAIEAALMHRDIPPGEFRENFGFMHLKPYNQEDWDQLKEESKDNWQPAARSFKIIASDIDARAIDVAKKNATLAGVAQLIDFQVCDFADTQIPAGQGVVIVNPAYGERMGEEESLVPIYQRLGDFFKQKCKGYTGYVFTGNPDLAKKIGLRTSKRYAFYNGTIECRLLEYQLYGGSKKKPPAK